MPALPAPQAPRAAAGLESAAPFGRAIKVGKHGMSDFRGVGSALGDSVRKPLKGLRTLRADRLAGILLSQYRGADASHDERRGGERETTGRWR
ncbi:hypothetical protein ACFSLT_28925 [Novosphingobium resinovorum]